MIGDNANRKQANGGGSAEIKALFEITPVLGIAKAFGGNTEVKYTKGYYVPPKKTEEYNWQAESVNIEDVYQAVAQKKDTATDKKKGKSSG